MARRFLRLELSTQLFILLGLLAVTAALTFALARLSLAQAKALDRARTAADLVSTVFVRSGALVASAGIAERYPLLRDLVSQDGSGANGLEVRVSSAGVAANAALSRFEFMALETLRDPAISEYHEVIGARMFYATRLQAAPCHSGCAEKGELAATPLVTVSAPILEGGAALPQASVEYGLSLCAIVVAAVLVLIGWWLRQLIQSARVLEGFADRVVNAAPGEPVARVSLDEDEHDSSNELHRLSLRLRALYHALHQLQSERVPQK